MIQFRPAAYSEIESCLPQDFAKQNHRDSSLKYFGVFDGSVCIGFSQYKLEENAHLLAIYIIEQERNQKFGDGLFRATLNAIERSGFDLLTCSGNSDELRFYLHEGLEQLNEHQVILNSIKAFFNQPCRSKR